jgi:hypothetical protein
MSTDKDVVDRLVLREAFEAMVRAVPDEVSGASFQTT